MHILLLDLGHELRGGQLQVFYLARALARCSDFQPLVASPRNSSLAILLKKENIPTFSLPGRNPFNPMMLFALERALYRHSIRIIHTHDAHAAALGAFLKAVHGNRLLLIHSRRVSYLPHSGLRLKKYLLADAVVGVSNEISTRMIEVGIPAEKIHTIHSGIDPHRYRPKEQRNDKRIIFLSIGALTPQKGYSVLVRAMSVLDRMERLPPWEVRIVGEGPLFNDILEEAIQLGVAPHLALLGRQDARTVLPLCDILVTSSIDGEGSSAVIKEGWATGLPVICSSLPSNTELVTDNIDGLVTETGSPVALAEAMALCMTEVSLRKRLATQGKKSIRQFTDQRMADKYMSLYRHLENLSK